MNNLKKILLIFFILCFSFCQAKTQKEEYQNDILYSQEYFDYLIESATIEYNEQKELEKQKAKEEVTLQEEESIVVEENMEPFRLRTQETVKINPYFETFKVVDTKTIIPVNDNFSFIQNMKKTKNKYNSNDYRIMAGAEGSVGIFSLASGLETNYRGYDQLPISRKFYLTPSINLGDRVSLRLHNKVNVSSHVQDCDLELNLSPFKSKAVDFGVYAGTSRLPSGTHSESINFSTSFFF